MRKATTSHAQRLIRHHRLRKRVSGSQERPRLCVFRSLRHIYAQVIDDARGRTLVSACSLELQSNGATNRKDTARQVGLLVAQRAVEHDIRQVVFDRGGYAYHGRVKSLAEAAREGGLSF